jgi:hypothetical protein
VPSGSLRFDAVGSNVDDLDNNPSRLSNDSTPGPDYDCEDANYYIFFVVGRETSSEEFVDDLCDS